MLKKRVENSLIFNFLTLARFQTLSKLKRNKIFNLKMKKMKIITKSLLPLLFAFFIFACNPPANNDEATETENTVDETEINDETEEVTPENETEVLEEEETTPEEKPTIVEEQSENTETVMDNLKKLDNTNISSTKEGRTEETIKDETTKTNEKKGRTEENVTPEETTVKKNVKRGRKKIE